MDKTTIMLTGVLLTVPVVALAETLEVPENTLGLVRRETRFEPITVPAGTILEGTRLNSGYFEFSRDGEVCYIHSAFVTPVSSFTSHDGVSVKETQKIPGSDFSIGATYRWTDPRHFAKLMARTTPFVDHLAGAFSVPSESSRADSVARAMSYFEQLSLEYEFNLKRDQIAGIEDGKTRCYGATLLMSKLLDKTSVPYRVVASYFPKNANGSHIYLEVQNDCGLWVRLDPTNLMVPYKNLERFRAHGGRDVVIENMRRTAEGGQARSGQFPFVDRVVASGDFMAVSPSIFRGHVDPDGFFRVYRVDHMDSNKTPLE